VVVIEKAVLTLGTPFIESRDKTKREVASNEKIKISRAETVLLQ
jgi:hypothetical protein